MPTGYTACIEEGATFEQFLWTAARGMGALIMMRDNSLSEPVPDKFKPSSYYKDKIAEIETAIESVTQMSDADVVHRQNVELNDTIRENKKRQKRYEATAERYENILKQVEAWVPPTPDHEGLKNFMIEQIHESTRFNGLYLEKIVPIMNPAAWRQKKVSKLADELCFAKNYWVDEQRRTNERNDWIKALRESVPQPLPFQS